MREIQGAFLLRSFLGKRPTPRMTLGPANEQPIEGGLSRISIFESSRAWLGWLDSEIDITQWLTETNLHGRRPIVPCDQSLTFGALQGDVDVTGACVPGVNNLDGFRKPKRIGIADAKLAPERLHLWLGQVWLSYLRPLPR